MAPVIVVGAAWLGGTLAAHELPELPSVLWTAALVLVALLALHRPAFRPLLWFGLAVAWTCYSAGVRLAERLPATALGQDFVLTGVVAGFPVPAPGQITFAFAVAEPHPPAVPSRVRLTWYDPPAVAAGDVLTLTARLRPPHGARNPGGFDYEQWLWVNAYGATGYVRAAAAGPGSGGVAAAWLRFRATLAERLGRAGADPDGAALLTALALGERQRFTEQHWADFRRTGTSHLVAVSGMHVALLGLVAFVAVRFGWLRLPAPLYHFDLEAAAVASVLATAYYAALTGFAIPAQRSLAMVATALAILVGRRRVGPLQALAAATLVVLVWDPFAPLTASFWLSFTAVAILLLLASPRPLAFGPATRLRRAGAAVREFTGLQWTISAALVPLTVWFFGELSLVGPFVNLVAIPWFNLVLVPLTLLATVVASFDALAAWVTPAIALLGQLAALTVHGLHAAAVAPGAAVAVPMPPPLVSLVAACGVLLAVAGRSLPGGRLAWLAVLPLFAPALPLLPPGAVHAVVLDVGHGLAVLVETRRHRLVYDAGPTSRSGFDSGEAHVLPALGAAGRRGLDLMIVSHADNDHAGGAPAVAGAFPGLAVLMGPDLQTLSGRVCERGQQWEWDGVRFGVLHPGRDFAPRGNDSSCVLRVAAAGGTLLIAGDIERRGEAALSAEPVAADVVVVPHHGSATSSSAAFVAAVDADYAIVSAGFANRWGFPRPEIRARWQESGARVVVTSESGAVNIEIGAAGVVVTGERDGRHRYWRPPRFPW